MSAATATTEAQLRHDRNAAFVGMVIWCVGAFKAAPHMPRSAHIQAAAGALGERRWCGVELHEPAPVSSCGAVPAAAAAVYARHMCLPCAAVTLVAFLWPVLHGPSYLRRRTAILSSMRLFAIALPANYDSALCDALAPRMATGRLAWAVNMSHVLMGALWALAGQGGPAAAAASVRVQRWWLWLSRAEEAALAPSKA